jgi:hypothetical protein
MDLDPRINHRLWAGLLAGPFSFLMTLQTNYMLVDLACGAGLRPVLHFTPPIAILITAGGGFMAWQASKELSHRTAPVDGVALSRGRFMAFTAMLMCTFFVLVLLAQWIPVFFIDPCRR